jgi:nicotinamide-nucleotide amidase
MSLATLTQVLIEHSLTISVAESCTGGNLSSLLTSVSGSSAYFDRGYVAYSNQAKVDMLGVDLSTLTQFGAVSEQTAQAMVKGVAEHSNSDVSVAITGIAGPTGGTQDKPVGMVCFGFYIKGNYFTNTQYYTGDRVTVIASSVDFVIQTLVDELSA